MTDAMNTNFFGDLGEDEIEELTAELTSGTYLFELTNIHTYHKEDTVNPEKTRDSLVFSWTVCDETSEKYGIDFQQWFQIFPDLTPEIMQVIPITRKAEIRRSIGFLKSHLERLGVEDFSGFTPASLKEDLNGLRAYIDILVDDKPNSFVKVKKITLEKNVDTVNNGTENFEF